MIISDYLHFLTGHFWDHLAHLLLLEEMLRVENQWCRFKNMFWAPRPGTEAALRTSLTQTRMVRAPYKVRQAPSVSRALSPVATDPRKRDNAIETHRP